jgi:hypothetical protein
MDNLFKNFAPFCGKKDCDERYKFIWCTESGIYATNGHVMLKYNHPVKEAQAFNVSHKDFHKFEPFDVVKGEKLKGKLKGNIYKNMNVLVKEDDNGLHEMKAYYALDYEALVSAIHGKVEINPYTVYINVSDAYNALKASSKEYTFVKAFDTNFVREYLLTIFSYFKKIGKTSIKMSIQKEVKNSFAIFTDEDKTEIYLNQAYISVPQFGDEKWYEEIKL